MSDSIWSNRVKRLLREMSGAEGRQGGEAPIVSMGTTAPPMVEVPRFILDHLVSDGAQVTRPSIDPYREPIETHVYLFEGQLRLSMPVLLSCMRLRSQSHLHTVYSVSYRLGLLMMCSEGQLSHKLEEWGKFIVRVSEEKHRLKDGKYCKEARLMRRAGLNETGKVQRLAIVPSIFDTGAVLELVREGYAGIIIDEDIEGSDCPLEVAVSRTDRALKESRDVAGDPLRWRASIIAISSRVRGSHDAFKLLGLGADIVGLDETWQVGIEYSEGMPDEDLSDRLEAFLLAVQKELKLLAGAAGVSSLYTSLIGNRELFRGIELDAEVRRLLGVKAAGE